MTKVSIITPVYNPKEEHLHECIQSLIKQSLEEIEIILIDNGAINNNSQILEDYSKQISKIKVIKFKKNVGFSKACNAALTIAKGEYIQIVDSDDILNKNACEILYKKAQKNNADLIIFATCFLNDKTKEREYNHWYSLENFPIKSAFNCFSSVEGVDFVFKSPLQDWNKFVKRELLYNNNNFFDEDLKYVLPDCIYSIKNIINAKRIIIEKEHLYDYRINISSSVVKGYTQKNCSYIDAPIIFSKKLDKILEREDGNIFASEIIKISIVHLFSYYSMIHKKNRKILYNLIHDYLKNHRSKYLTKSLLKEIGYYKQIKDFYRYNYFFYNLKRFFYRNEKNAGVVRINICGLNVYKKKYANFKIYRRYFGFLKTTEEDFNARQEYIINRTTHIIKELLTTEKEKEKLENFK